MTKPEFRLFHYWRSSSSWRVRWAFAIKKVPYEPVSINLLTDESETSEHLSRSPMGVVPVLEFLQTFPRPKSRYLTESTAIIEWLNEVYPSPPLFPKEPLERALVRQLAEIINSGTQPLQNPSVGQLHSPDPEEQKRWNQIWIRRGLKAYETLVQNLAGEFSFGDSVTVADLFLIPQCYNSIRNGIDLGEYPTMQRIYETALKTEACAQAAPERFAPTR